MSGFDVSREWHILAPVSIPAVRNAAEKLAGYIGLLRKQSGLDKGPPPLEDAQTTSLPDSIPVILLNTGAEGRDRSGFSWRAGPERIEIYGDSSQGLRNGVFDFLGALGFRWPKPDLEQAPAAPSLGFYPLKNSSAFRSSVVLTDNACPY